VASATPNAVESSSDKQSNTACPAGTVVVSPAFDLAGSIGEVYVRSSRRDFTTVNTAVANEQPGGSSRQWRMASYAVCAAP
jgi:hypothetical protein